MDDDTPAAETTLRPGVTSRTLFVRRARNSRGFSDRSEIIESRRGERGWNRRRLG